MNIEREARDCLSYRPRALRASAFVGALGRFAPVAARRIRVPAPGPRVGRSTAIRAGCLSCGAYAWR